MLNSESLKLKEQYINELVRKEKISMMTLDVYSKEIDEFMEYLDEESLLKVRPLKIMNYIQFLKKKYSDITVKRKIASLKGLYKYFLKKELIEASPLEGIKVQIKEKKIDSKAGIGHFNRILDFCHSDPKGLRDKMIITLLMKKVFKINDILNIKTSEIINEQEINTLILGEITAINLNKDEANLLKEYSENRIKILEKKENYLFKEITRQNFRARFQKYCRLAGIEEFSPSEIKKTIKKHEEKTQNKDEFFQKIREEYIRIGIGDD
ncbi:MAG: tyrosine-type recombinase/integrase [Fusobacteriaceae bacterium]